MKPHDPAPLSSPDRVTRGEVCERVWAELPVGQVQLTAGRTRLVVRALEVPGGQVMELKGVRLRRVE